MPFALRADAVNVYSVWFVSPVTTSVVAVELYTEVDCRSPATYTLTT